MLRRLLLLAALLCWPALAQADEIEGKWDMRIEGTTIFRFTIEEGDGGEWHGTWSRPDHFNSNGNAFGELRGPVETLSSNAGYEFAGLIELSFPDARPGAVPDIFRFKLLDEDEVEMTYVGTGLAPYLLVRAGEADAIGNWDASKVFRREVPGDPDYVAPRRRNTAPGTEAPQIRPESFRLDGEQEALPAPAEGDADGPPAQLAEDAQDIAEPEAEQEEEARIGADFLDGF